MDSIQNMSYRELQAEAKRLGIKANGTKVELLARISESVQAEAPTAPATPQAQIGISGELDEEEVEEEDVAEEEVVEDNADEEEDSEEVEAKNMAADFKTEASAEVSDIFSELKEVLADEPVEVEEEVDEEEVASENLQSPIGSRMAKFEGKKTYFASPVKTPKPVSKWTIEDYDKDATPKRNALTEVNH